MPSLTSPTRCLGYQILLPLGRCQELSLWKLNAGPQRPVYCAGQAVEREKPGQSQAGLSTRGMLMQPCSPPPTGLQATVRISVKVRTQKKAGYISCDRVSGTPLHPIHAKEEQISHRTVGLGAAGLICVQAIDLDQEK